MRLGERTYHRYAGLRGRRFQILTVLIAIASWFSYRATISVLVHEVGSRNSYFVLARSGIFILVLLETAIISGLAAVATARRAAWPARAAVFGSCAGAIPELTIPVLALAGALRLPVGIFAVLTTVVDFLSLPGRGLALLLGHSSSSRWMVGLSDPPTAWVAQCWSLVVAGDVFAYGVGAAFVGMLVARRWSDGGEPHNKSLKRTRSARRLAQSR